MGAPSGAAARVPDPRENAVVAARGRSGSAALLVRVAIAAYAANCLLGLAVASRAVRLGRARWLHHALFVVTAATAGTAASSAIWARSRAGSALVPALLPLALVPYRSATVRQHIVAATTAAPAYLAAATALRSGQGR